MDVDVDANSDSDADARRACGGIEKELSGDTNTMKPSFSVRYFLEGWVIDSFAPRLVSG